MFQTNVVKFFINIFVRVVVFQTGSVMVHRVGQRVQAFFTAPLSVQILSDQLQYFR